MTDEDLVKMVEDWWKDNYRYVKLDECYGLDFTAEVLRMLIEVRNTTAKLP